MSLGYRANVENKPNKPTRLFFFRDGVSEGEFEQVLDLGKHSNSSALSLC